MSKSIIESVSTVNLQSSRCYRVGQVINGMKVAEILNLSLEYEDHVFTSYTGVTSEGDNVFSVENAPVEVLYKIQTEGPEPW